MDILKQNSKMMAAIFALLTIICSLNMLFQYPAQANLSEGYNTPVLAFEFARTQEDLGFLTGDSKEALDNRIAMRLGQSYDTLFPFLYAGMIAFCILRVSNKIDALPIIGIIISILIIPSDLYENSIMNAIIDSLDSGQSVTELLSALYFGTWLKWGSIAISMMILSLVSYLNKDWYPSFLISAITSLMILLTWITGSPIVAEIMMVSVTLFFSYFGLRSIYIYFRSLRS